MCKMALSAHICYVYLDRKFLLYRINRVCEFAATMCEYQTLSACAPRQTNHQRAESAVLKNVQTFNVYRFFSLACMDLYRRSSDYLCLHWYGYKSHSLQYMYYRYSKSLTICVCVLAYSFIGSNI
jgi:hypothetical protein